jgi:hypothetical protein
MNVLILVLSARREPWGALMDCSMDTWDYEKHPQTRTLYYCGKSDKFPSDSVVFYSPQFDEELERVAPRTMEAYEHALTIPNWDFMARTHSSTYVHKRNLVDFCETLHRNNLLCGLLVTGERPFLWGGGSYIMSRDVIEQLVANKDKWDNGIMEDNSLTNLANELGIPMNGKGRMASIDGQGDGSYQVTTYGVGEGFRFSNWDDINKAQPHYYFRCKQDLRRHEDLVIFRQLHKHLR